MTSQARSASDAVNLEEKLGRVIQELRRQRKLSQEKLGFESGLHRTYISLLERGKRSPTMTTLIKLAIALNVPPSEIVRRVETHLGWTVGKTAESDL